MKCLSCDKILSSYESTRRFTDGNNFVDLCNNCFRISGINFVLDRLDLISESDIMPQYDNDAEEDNEDIKEIIQ